MDLKPLPWFISLPINRVIKYLLISFACFPWLLDPQPWPQDSASETDSISLCSLRSCSTDSSHNLCSRELKYVPRYEWGVLVLLDVIVGVHLIDLVQCGANYLPDIFSFEFWYHNSSILGFSHWYNKGGWLWNGVEIRLHGIPWFWALINNDMDYDEFPLPSLLWLLNWKP